MQFESYYDESMMQWTVRNTETLVMYPCTSENMANEFRKLLNELDAKYIDEYALRETLQLDLQRVEEENKQLKTELLNIGEDRDYFKVKASNLEEGYIKLQDQEIRLKEELDYWKKRALLLEKKYDEGDSVKWLRENTVWEQMPSTRKTKISVSDINGMVKTDEPTNSVELKKKLYK